MVSAVQLKEVEVILQQHEGTLQPPAHDNARTAAQAATAAAAPAAACTAACTATDLLGRAAPPPPSRPSFVIGELTLTLTLTLPLANPGPNSNPNPNLAAELL